MPMHVHLPGILFIMAIQLFIAASITAPEAFPCATFELWLKLRSLPELYRQRRLERKSRELEKKLKSCWLVDLRKSH